MTFLLTFSFRISQVCEMYAAGFRFVVMAGMFLVHTGFKREATMHKRKEEEQAINRKKYRTFKQELRAKYPERRC